MRGCGAVGCGAVELWDAELQDGAGSSCVCVAVNLPRARMNPSVSLNDDLVVPIVTTRLGATIRPRPTLTARGNGSSEHPRLSPIPPQQGTGDGATFPPPVQQDQGAPKFAPSGMGTLQTCSIAGRGGNWELNG